MSGDQTASLIYLVLLGCVIASYFFVSHRVSLGRGLRMASLWFFIFIGVIVAYGLWEDVSRTVLPRQTVSTEDGSITVPLGRDGHYHMVLEVNGVPVEFIVDTGATDMVLSQQDAERVGLDPDSLQYFGVANTANGQVKTASVRLDEVDLGGIRDTGVRAVVNGGEMNGSLLGMRYLNRFSEVTFGGGQMVLSR